MLPKLTDVWRFVKILLSAYVNSKKGQGEDFECMHALKALFSCERAQDLLPTVETLLQFKSDAERILKLLKSRYRLSKKSSLSEIELLLLQKAAKAAGGNRNASLKPQYNSAGQQDN